MIVQTEKERDDTHHRSRKFRIAMDFGPLNPNYWTVILLGSPFTYTSTVWAMVYLFSMFKLGIRPQHIPIPNAAGNREVHQKAHTFTQVHSQICRKASKIWNIWVPIMRKVKKTTHHGRNVSPISLGHCAPESEHNCLWMIRKLTHRSRFDWHRTWKIGKFISGKLAGMRGVHLSNKCHRKLDHLVLDPQRAWHHSLLPLSWPARSRWVQLGQKKVSLTPDSQLGGRQKWSAISQQRLTRLHLGPRNLQKARWNPWSLVSK